MTSQRKVAVIGAGWFGCHVALELKLRGVEVAVFEATDAIFAMASGKNQFRLHQGFHHARSKNTRMQAKFGFDRFVNYYPEFSSIPNGENYYFVPFLSSLIDFETYLDIMKSSGLHFKQVDGLQIPIKGIEGAIAVEERVIKTQSAINYFSNMLKENLFFKTEINEIKYLSSGCKIQNKHFDWVIDATWSHRVNKKEILYEPTLLLYIDGKGFQDALTLVDGNLWSLYPTEKVGIMTLSHVNLTPLGRYWSSKQALLRINSISQKELVEQSNKMLYEVAKNFPQIMDMKVVGYQLSVKSKKRDASESRFANVSVDGREINIFSGKIDAIFDVADQILSTII